MFKAAEKEYGKIDHVFANAGISPTITLLEDDVDENGDLLPPKMNTLNVNLTGCLYTVKLGIHYLKKNPNGGSIVITASGSSFARFPATDYSTRPSTMRSFTGILIIVSNIQTRRPRPPPRAASPTPPSPTYPHQRHRSLLDANRHRPLIRHCRAWRRQLPIRRCGGALRGRVDG